MYEACKARLTSRPDYALYPRHVAGDPREDSLTTARPRGEDTHQPVHAVGILLPHLQYSTGPSLKTHFKSNWKNIY